MANDYWRTPARVLAPAYLLQAADTFRVHRTVTPGVGIGSVPFGLDPFATKRGVTSHVRADHYLREDRRRRHGGGAFAEAWKPLARDKLGWGNPPYGRDKLGPSMARMMDQADTGVWFLGLVPASTDVKWFHACWAHADQVCFHRGRIKFEDPRPRPEKNSALFPNVTFHWAGDVRREARMEAFHRIYSGHVGIVVPCKQLAQSGIATPMDIAA